jgi:hypothetical protein
VGEFDLSHDSLTSAEALATLRQLPITNPPLDHEISTTETCRITEDTEPPFPAEAEQGDESDIPIDVVRSVVVAEGCMVDGYKLDVDGDIVRTRVAEDLRQTIEGEAGSSAILPTTLWPWPRSSSENRVQKV